MNPSYLNSVRTSVLLLKPSRTIGLFLQVLFVFMIPFLGFSQLSGNYVIRTSNSDANFKTLSAAVARINAVGVSGPVTFLLDENQNATSQITISQLKGSSTVNTLTIKPNVGKNIKITANKLNAYSGVPAVFLFNGAQNMVIDGSNSSLSTKNLELINNDDLDYLYRSIIWIASNSTVPSSNITVKNSTLTFVNRTQQTNLLAAVYSGNNSIGGNNTISMSPSTASNSNISIKNNVFVNVKEGVHVNGDASKRPINWSIQNNTMEGGASEVTKLNRGIYMSNSSGYTISNNTISGVLRYSNATQQETAGISIVGESSGTIDSNSIDDVSNINYASDGDIGGIFINTNAGVTITVSNNMISNVYSGAKDSNDWNYYYKGFGIYVKSGGTTNLYFNTVVLNNPNAGGLTSCLYLERGNVFNIKNNIFYNSQPGIQYGIFSRIAVSTISSISNNDYYITNAAGDFSNRLGSTSYTGTSGFTTWKTALGNKDTGSIIVLPTFVSAADFHLLNSTANDELKGVTISGITTDIDGQTREKPYMGADEICSAAVPIIGTITQPDCITPTGSVILSGLPTGSWVITPTPNTAGLTGITGSTNSTTVDGLKANTTYTFEVTNSKGCSSPNSAQVVISTSSAKTWNGKAWSPSAPTSADAAIINGNFNTTTNGELNVCSLVMNAGFTLTIGATKPVIIQNDLTVNGTLDILDKASLVMINDSGKVIYNNGGMIKVHRITSPFKEYDYVYWSTPVISTAISSQNFPGWNIGYSYEFTSAMGSEGDWSFASTMTPGKGYSIMVPTPKTGSPSNSPSEIIFSGAVNNGIKKIQNVIPNRSYLLGNPYPSAIDANEFLKQNAGAIDGTLYFWTHNTAIQSASNIESGKAGSGALAFTSDDYASYNITGGTAVAPSDKLGNQNNKPTGRIASCQGFFATSNSTIVGTKEIVFNNSMRLGLDKKALNNTQFFKTKDPKNAKTSAETIEKSRIWLNLTNPEGAFKQTLIGYLTGATNENDNLYDGKTFDGQEFIDFYSINEKENLTIQGRALPFDEKDEIPLGFRSTIDGSFTISIDEVDGLMTNQSVFLEDKLTNAFFDLKNGDYTFNTLAGTFDDRFVLKFSNKTLSLDSTEKEDGILVFYSSNYKTLIIHNKKVDSAVNSVSLFNMLGQNIGLWDVKDNEQTNIQIPIKDISSGLYIVKVKTANGDSNKKIMVR